MTAITTGTGLGLFNASLDTLGGAGSGGSAPLGRTGERVYVNAATGNLVVHAQDEYLASLGLDLGVVRTYNAQGQWTDDNGDNWRLNVAALAGLTGTVNTSGSTLTKVFGDGAEVTYTYDDAQGLYVATAGDGAHDTLSSESSTGEWTWTDGSSRLTETFNADGRLATRRDLDGNTTTYAYTGSLLTQITDASGQVTELVYAGTNLTEIHTSSDGLTQTRVRYGYDSLNRLTEVTVDLSPEDGSISDGHTYVTRYSYDGTSTRIASITQGDGTHVAFTYVELNGQWQVKTVTDGEGHTSVYSYDAVNRETTVTDPLGAVTRYRYDLEGRLSVLTDANGATTTYGYDPDGNLASLLNANGEAIAFTYDENGNLVLKRDATGNTVTYTYSSANQLLTETVYLVKDPDGAGPGQPGLPQTTRYVYDAEGHLRFSVSAEGRVREHRYDAAGNRTTSIAYRSGVYDLTGLAPSDTLSEAALSAWASSQDKTETERADYAYDFRGQLSTTTTYAQVDASGQGVTDGSHSVTRFLYDPAGRLLETIEARGEASADPTDYRTAYTYDGLGRLLATHQWVSATETRITVTAYDDLNQRLTTTLANGLATTQTFDRAGRLVSVSQSDPARALGTTTYQYDAAGRLRTTTDPTGLAVHVIYDEAGRPTITIDASGAATEAVYDPAGNVVKTIRYATALTGAQRASLVDGNGNPADVSVGSIRPPASADDRVAFTLYDKAGRVAMTIAPHDTDPAQGYVMQSFYDGAGRLTDVIEYAAPLSLAGLPALPTADDIVPRLLPSDEDRHSRSFYDDDGILLASLDAAGTLTRYRYGSSGRLEVSFTFAVAVDPMVHAGGDLDTLVGSISAQTGGDHSGDLYTWYFHNGKGELIGTLDAESYLTEHRYDAAGNEIERIRYANRTAPYPRSRPTQELLNDLRPAPSANDRITLTGYNGANQVVSVTVLPENTVTTHTYDAVGNRIRSDRAWNNAEVRTTLARYDAQGRLTQELAGEGSAALEALLGQNPNASQEEINAIWSQWGLGHAYDAAGRRTRTTDQNGHTTLFYYDPSSRLAYTVNALGEVSHNVYNALGQLVDTTRHTHRIDTTGLAGGLVTQDIEARVQAIANPAGANPDARTQYNYTLRGAVKEAIYAPGSATEGKTAYAYNAFGERIAETLRLDGTTSRLTEYRYDRRGRLTQTIEDLGGLQRTTQSEYDVFGRRIRTLDGRGNATDYGYDRIGRRVTVTDPDGMRTSTYDAFDRVLTRTDALGHTTTYRYDDAQRRFTVTTPEGIETTTETNAHGETVAITDGNGNTTRYAYDRNGNLTEVTQAEGRLDLTTAHTYDHAGLRLTSTDANGTLTEYQYDATNRLLSRTVDPAGLALTTSYSYDGQGRVLTTTDANGTVTRTDYDPKGQVMSVTVDPVDPVTNPDGLNLVTTYTYDDAGRTLTVTEGANTPEARTTEYRYDPLGRRIAQIQDPSDSATGNVGLNLTTTYVYDLNGNLIAKTEGEGTAEARTTRYVYDANNRLTDTVDALGAVSHRHYDAAGNLIRTVEYAIAIDLTGLTTITAAELAARLSASPSDRTTGYVYDTDNRRVYTVNSLGYVTEARYDANGNVITQIAYATAIPTTTATTEAVIAQAVSLIADPTRDHIARTVYDAANRAVYNINARGYVTQSAYDPSGHVVQTTAYAAPIALDGLPTSPTEADLAAALAARLAPQSNKDQISEFNYDAAGRLTSITQAVDTPDQFTETYAYDAVGREIRHTNGRGDIEYSAYDAAGHLTRHIDYMGYVVDTSHDALGQLKTKTVHMNAVAPPAVATDRWAYETPNPVSDTDPVSGDRTIGYAYDAVGRLIDETDPMGVVTHYVYGAFGQVREKTLAYGTAEASTIRTAHDVLGRLIEQTTAYGALEASTSRFGYNAFGNQIAYIDPRGVELAETDSDWAQAERLRLGYAITEESFARAKRVAELNPVEREQLKALYTTTQSYDTLNRKVSVTDALGAITTTAYDAFGNIVKVTDPNNNAGYFYYDVLNRLALQLDPEGYATENTYNAFGKAIETVKYANRAQGSYSETNPPVTADTTPVAGAYLLRDPQHDQRTFAEYDALDRTTKITDAEGYHELYTYDAQGNVTSKTDKNGYTTSYEYDRNNRRIAEHLPITSRVDVWEDAQLIGTYAGGAIVGPEMAVDGHGNAVAVWVAQAIEGYKVYASAYVPGQGWQTPAHLQTSPNSATNLKVAFDAAGNALALWQQAAAGGTAAAVDIYAARYVAGQGWGTPSRLDAGDGEVSGADIALDAQGNAIAVWSQVADVQPYFIGVGSFTTVTAGGVTTTTALSGSQSDVTPPALKVYDSTVASSVRSTQYLAAWRSGENWPVYGQHQKVVVSWPSLAEFGGGDVTVTVNFRRSDGSTGAKTRVLSAASALTGATITWDEVATAYFVVPPTLTNVTHVVVSKVVAGQAIDVIDAPGSGRSKTFLFWDKPALADTDVTLRHRPVDAGGDWTAAAKLDSGTHYIVDASTFAVGQYDYEMSYLPPVTSQKTIWASRYAISEGWGAAERIETDDRGSATTPAIAFAGNGDAFAIWSQADGAGVASIWVNCYDAATATWTAPFSIETSTGQASEPHITVNADGSAIAAWVQSDGAQANLYASRYVPTQGWEPPALIESAAGAVSAPRIVSGPRSDAVAVWTQRDGTAYSVYANRYVAGAGWQGAELIDNSTTNADTPQAVIDTRGDITVVWAQSDGNAQSIYSRRYVHGVGWQGATLLESAAGTAAQPRIALDAQGNAFVAWRQNDGVQESVYANRYAAVAEVVKRYAYDAVDNNTKTIEAAGLPEERITQYVYDKNNRLVGAIEPQVLAQQLIVPANAGALTAGAGGTVTATLTSTVINNIPRNLLKISWPAVVGFGDGNIRIEWVTAQGTFSSTVSSSARSASVLGGSFYYFQPNPIAGPYTVKIYKQSLAGDVLLYSRSDAYSFPPLSFDGSNPSLTMTGQMATTFHFSGQPTSGKALRIVYWPSSDLNNVTELDLASYSPGTFSGLAPKILAGEFGYEAKVFDADGEVVNHVTGGFTAGGGTMSTSIVSAGNFFTNAPSQLSVSWAPVGGLGTGNIRIVWNNGAATYSVTVSEDATSAVVYGAPLSAYVTTPQKVKIYKQTAQGEILLSESPDSFVWGPNSTAGSVVTTPMLGILQFTGQPATGTSLHLVCWPVSDPSNITRLDLPSYVPGTFAGPVSKLLAGEFAYEATVLDAAGEIVSELTGSFTIAHGAVISPAAAQPLLSGTLQSPHTYRSYDARGNATMETDARGNVTYHYYDASNRRLGTVDAEGYLHRYYYNAAGNLITERTYGDKIPDGVSLATLPDPAAVIGTDHDNYREIRYRYNANNLLIETQTREVRVYDRANGLRTQALMASIVYDANGNRALETDANGNKTYSYYDKTGRKIALVDPLGDITAFELDGNGNVVKEIRYATALSAMTLASLSTASDPSALKAEAEVAHNAGDRIMVYTYDRLNRRVAASVFNLAVTSIDVLTGAATTVTQTATTRYEYDGVGNRTAQIDATGARTDYGFDGLNRLISGQDPIFTDFEGVSVRKTTLMAYNGTGNVASVTQRGNASVDDQITRYEYDSSGNLTREIDPLGGPTRYYYDLNGNITVKHERNTNPDGTQPAVDTFYTYDKLNRQVTTQNTYNFVDHVKYNAYDEIIAKGLNGLDQEYYEYDRAGRLIKTNQDDGVDRAYLYDANGNETAEIQSAVQDTNINMLVMGEIELLDATRVQVTQSAYDGRNQLAATYKAPMDFAVDAVSVEHVWVDAQNDPFSGGSLTAMNGGTATMKIASGVVNGLYTPTMTATWPPVAGFGDGKIKVVWSNDTGTFSTTIDGSATKAVVNGKALTWPASNTYQDIRIYKETAQGNVLIARSPVDFKYINNYTSPIVDSTSVQVPNVLHFSGQQAEATTLQLWIWPKGEAKPTDPILVPQIKNSADAPIDGWFMFDWSGYRTANYEYEFKTFDGSGVELAYVKGDVTLVEKRDFATMSIGTAVVGGLYTPTMTATWPPVVGFGDGNIRVEWCNNTGTFSTTVSGNATSAVVNGVGLQWPEYNSHQDVRIYKETAQGDVLLARSPADFIYSTYSSFNPNITTSAQMPRIYHFTGQPAGATSMQLWLWPVGIAKPESPVSVPQRLDVTGTPIPGWFLFDWTNYVPGDYQYELKTFDEDGAELDNSVDSVTLSETSLVNSKFVDTVQPIFTPGAPVSNVIVRSQTYNAFGEITHEIDGRGYATQFVYNALGQLIKKTDPETDATLETGAIVRVNPLTQYYYDAAGRTVAMRDANGNLTSQRYDAAGNLIAEYHADGGTKVYGYDVFGNKRFVDNELGERTRYTYDQKNRVTRIDRPTGAAFGNAARYDLYYYDEADRRIKHTNSLGDSELTYYDDIGRVKKTVSYGGLTTSYRYIYDAAGGGSTLITTQGDGKSLTDTKDYFGRLLTHQDLGGRTYNYLYNEAGWLVGQTGDTNLSVAGNEQNITFNYYHNGYLKEVIDTGVNTRTRYEYDANGNRTFEGYYEANGNVYYQWSRAEYDELSRLKAIDDPKYRVSYEYDANGNRRHVYAYYHDGLNGSIQTQDYWYAYDSMNRFLVTKGALVDAEGNVIDVEANPGARGSGRIAAGPNGVALAYNAASQRAGSTYLSNGATVNEIYVYAADGLLWQTHIDGTKRAERSYNALGAATSYKEFDETGAVKTSIAYSYTKDGQTNTENGPSGNSIYYYDNAGTLTNVVTAQSGGTTLTTTYSYAYWDSAKQTEIKVQASNASAPGWAPGFSKFTYDVNGHLVKVSDVVGNRHLSYRLDADGRILQRNELIGTTSSRTQNYYYLNGIGIGDAGSFGASRTDYASVLKQHEEEAYWRSQADLLNYKLNDKVRKDVQARVDQHQREVERNKAKPVRCADFDYSYQAINDRYPAMAPGTYTVQAGDSLQSIALKVWGDAGLWYLIADANGLADSAGLTAGQVLVIPNVVANIHNNATTFHVYNPGELIGDVSPTLPDPPPPPKPDNCGNVIAVIIVVIVAVVATILTEGTTAEFWAGVLGEMGVAAEAIPVVAGALDLATAAAAGSAASQAVGMGLGIQKKFDWGAVAIAAVSAGLTKGVLKGQPSAVKAVAGNLVQQGINTATGRQEHFNWAGLAAAAIAAPVTEAIGESMNLSTNVNAPGTVAAPTVAGFVGDLTRNLISGAITAVLTNKQGSIQWANVAASALGEAIGNAIAGDIQYERKLEKDRAAADLGNMLRPIGFSMDSYGLLPRDRSLFRVSDFETPGSVSGGADASTPAAHRYTAQNGDTVWGLTGGDNELIGEFRRLNGLSDADVIYTDKDYIVPTQVQDPAAARASFEQQAALWEAKDVAAQRAAEASMSSMSIDEVFALTQDARRRDPIHDLLDASGPSSSAEMRSLSPKQRAFTDNIFGQMVADTFGPLLAPLNGGYNPYTDTVDTTTRADKFMTLLSLAGPEMLAGLKAFGGVAGVANRATLAGRYGTTAERTQLLENVITTDGGLNTSQTVARQLAGPRNYIPNQSILDTVGSGTRIADPQGVAGQFMYRAPAQFNSSSGTLEVLVHEASGQVRHVLFRSGQ